MHPTIEIAVLAAWALDYMISRKEYLFTKKHGIGKFRSGNPQNGLYSNTVALITSDCGKMRSLSIKWP